MSPCRQESLVKLMSGLPACVQVHDITSIEKWQTWGNSWYRSCCLNLRPDVHWPLLFDLAVLFVQWTCQQLDHGEWTNDTVYWKSRQATVHPWNTDTSDADESEPRVDDKVRELIRGKGEAANTALHPETTKLDNPTSGEAISVSLMEKPTGCPLLLGANEAAFQKLALSVCDPSIYMFSLSSEKCVQHFLFGYVVPWIHLFLYILLLGGTCLPALCEPSLGNSCI